MSIVKHKDMCNIGVQAKECYEMGCIKIGMDIGTGAYPCLNNHL